MTTVPLEELHDHLDEYMSRSRNGERIRVTDQGREIVELSPVNASHEIIGTLRSAGKATWSGGKPRGLHDVEIEGEPISSTVLEDRR